MDYSHICSFIFTYMRLYYLLRNTNTVAIGECSLGLCNEALAKFTPEIVIFTYPVIGRTGQLQATPRADESSCSHKAGMFQKERKERKGLS